MIAGIEKLPGSCSSGDHRDRPPDHHLLLPYQARYESDQDHPHIGIVFWRTRTFYDFRRLNPARSESLTSEIDVLII